MRTGKRILLLAVLGAVLIGIIYAATRDSGAQPSALSRSSQGAIGSSDSVPWDYKIEEGKVGDLIGGDMTILPANQLLPNDNNYATGDKVWVLSHMTAAMTTRDDGKNDVTLSAWTPIKSYKSEEDAKKDMDNLKVEVKTGVDLVGVYKTEYEGQYRQFALVKLPSGHTIKQPVTEERYNAMKNKKQVQVILEEVHDFSNYDLAMAKFRGWAE